MARGARKKPDVYLAPQIARKALNFFKGLLVFVGKPLYLALIAFLYIAYFIGRSARVLFENVVSPIRRLPKPRKIKVPKIKVKPFFPKIRFAKIKVSPKIFWLKLQLFLLKIRFPVPKIGINVKLLTLVCLVFGFGFILWFSIIRDLPSPKVLLSREQEVSTKIYDRNGVLLYKIFKEKNRTPVPLEEIPLQVRLATLAAEDAEFYSHPGFSPRGILRAIVKNLRSGELSGGSTITQQLVKNALLSPEKTISRKIREIILSVETELTFSKDEILEMYLNEVSYGGTAYGIQEASRLYFAKDVDELSLAEAALLAGLPKSPTKHSPFGPNPELSFSRQREVLHLMKVNKYIDEVQEEEAKNQRLTFAPNKIDIKAPHFVMYIRQLLVDKYGEEVTQKGGLEVSTTLDYSIQKMAEEVVKSEVEKLSSLRVTNGAALVLSPQTGEILAMVGSKDYFDLANDGNVNVTVRPRQPGSSIKIVNYAYALSHDYTPATILSDTPVTFPVPGQPPYSPKNYDGAHRGSLTLRSALAESRNVPAVKVLASYGVAKMIDQGQKMGLTTWDDPGRFGLSLTLGGGEVKLIDLARVYATVANYGKKPEIVSVLKITNYKGKILEEFKCQKNNFMGIARAAEAAKNECEQEQVLDPRVSYLLIDILKDNSARAPAFGTNSALVIPGHSEVAVKTGTSNDLKDNLTAGFNQKYLVLTWVGNNDSSPMSRIASGVTGASPIWNKIMRALLADQKNHDWEVPEDLVQIPICTLTGTLPCEGCPVRLEWFLKERAPQKACFPETIQKINEEKKKEGQILDSGASTEATPTPKSLIRIIPRRD